MLKSLPGHLTGRTGVSDLGSAGEPGRAQTCPRTFAEEPVFPKKECNRFSAKRLRSRQAHPPAARRASLTIAHMEHCMAYLTTLTVNGITRAIELDDPRVTLLDLLRERLDLTGTKKGCDRGQCGACTVLVDGRRINSCLALAVSCDGAQIMTIEGLAQGDRLHPVQEAFIAHDGLQCGFCTPGQIMSAIGLIGEAQAGDDPERVREGMSGNLCRCGAYQGITEAVLEAQRTLEAKNHREVA
jgi:xanthine dehydrogenase YagT iron-sulfur-binding subunit